MCSALLVTSMKTHIDVFQSGQKRDNVLCIALHFTADL